MARRHGRKPRLQLLNRRRCRPQVQQARNSRSDHETGCSQEGAEQLWPPAWRRPRPRVVQQCPHRRRSVLRPRVEHRRNNRPQRGRHLGEIGNPLSGGDHRRRRRAHIELSAKADCRRREHQPQAVNVGPDVDLSAEQPDLLGRGIGVLAGEIAANDRQAGRIGRFGDAEIDNLRAVDIAFGEQNILRRHVPVNNVHLVRRREPARQAVAQP